MALSLDELASGVAAGERAALARALSLAERDAAGAADLLARLAGRLGRAHVIGITGPPGAGKSTLVGVLLRQFLQLGRSAAVLAVDPSSPLSGGALLGDRFRIGESAAAERAFVRSTATRGRLGGLNRATRQMVDLMDAAGFDLVVVETVGTGQSEADIAGLADALLVAFPPGLGDEMQAIKAGILELADMLVVSKSDTVGAATACQALRAMTPLWRRAPPIHPVSALSGEGVGELAAAILSHVQALGESRRRAGRLAERALPALAARLEALRRELERRLPHALAAGLSIEWVGPAPEAPGAGWQARVSMRPAGDAFRLGTVAGALIALAADMHLSCTVGERDPGGASMRVLLEDVAQAAEPQVLAVNVGAGVTAGEGREGRPDTDDSRRLNRGTR